MQRLLGQDQLAAAMTMKGGDGKGFIQDLIGGKGNGPVTGAVLNPITGGDEESNDLITALNPIMWGPAVTDWIGGLF